MPASPALPLLDHCLALLAEKDLAVLATCPAQAAAPHCSLMAYVLDQDRRHLLLVTPKKSRKYENLQANPQASLLVDTRESHPREAVQALTVAAVLAQTPAETLPALLEAFLARHPRLSAFARRPDAALIRLRMTSFQLLDGVEDARFMTLEG